MGAPSAGVRFALGSANTSSGSLFIESRRRGIFCSSPCAAGRRLGLDALSAALIQTAVQPSVQRMPAAVLALLETVVGFVLGLLLLRVLGEKAWHHAIALSVGSCSPSTSGRSRRWDRERYKSSVHSICTEVANQQTLLHNSPAVFH